MTPEDDDSRIAFVIACLFIILVICFLAFG